jgi:hypothetical protein
MQSGKLYVIRNLDVRKWIKRPLILASTYCAFVTIASLSGNTMGDSCAPLEGGEPWYFVLPENFLVDEAPCRLTRNFAFDLSGSFIIGLAVVLAITLIWTAAQALCRGVESFFRWLSMSWQDRG